MRRFAALAAVLAIALSTGAEARLRDANKAAEVQGKVKAPKAAVKPVANAVPVVAAPATPVTADATAATPVAADATAATPATTPVAADATAAAPLVNGPKVPKKLPASKKCLAKTGDVTFEMVGDNNWVDGTTKKEYIQRNYRITNAGEKPICVLDLFIPTDMEVFSSYGGLMKTDVGGVKSSAPQWGPIVPKSAAEFGFILQGDAMAIGEACVTAFEECKEGQVVPGQAAPAVQAEVKPQADAVAPVAPQQQQQQPVANPPAN